MPDHVVAFPEKLLKTIATRWAIFSLKFTKNHLAAGLCQDPLGEQGTATFGQLLKTHLFSAYQHV